MLKDIARKTCDPTGGLSELLANREGIKVGIQELLSMKK